MRSVVRLQVTDVCVLIDREQGAAHNLSHPPRSAASASASQWVCAPLRLHRVLTISQVLSVLHGEGKISQAMFATVTQFLQSNAQTTASTTNQTADSKSAKQPAKSDSKAVVVAAKPPAVHPSLLVPTALFAATASASASSSSSSAGAAQSKRLSLAARLPHVTHPLSRRIIQIMLEKKTNLCVSAGHTSFSDFCIDHICSACNHSSLPNALMVCVHLLDVTTSAALLALVHAVGPSICVLKTHIDILTDASPALYAELTRLSKLYNFVLFEDRKFADIGHTVSLQYAKVWMDAREFVCVFVMLNTCGVMRCAVLCCAVRCGW